MVTLTANISDELLPAGGFSEGSKFVIEATASHGTLLVERLTRLGNGNTAGITSPQSAIDRFLKKWHGRGGKLSVKLDEVADERLADLLHKHLK
ncbi:MAG: hypothetical protein RL693_2661 [Verrucomicrobiota bacterium]|jgi:hypothetical protein